MAHILAAANISDVVVSAVIIGAAVVALLERVGWLSLRPAARRLREENKMLSEDIERLVLRADKLEAENELLRDTTDISPLLPLIEGQQDITRELGKVAEEIRLNTAAVQFLASQLIVESGSVRAPAAARPDRGSRDGD